MEAFTYALKWSEAILRWGHVLFAIKDAIASISNYKIIPDLSAPATAEKILLSIKKLKNIV